MSDQEILKQAITKAMDNGWKPRDYESIEEVVCDFDVYKYGMRKITFFTDDAVRFKIPVYEVIFNHRFAKALWGDNPCCRVCGGRKGTPDDWCTWCDGGSWDTTEAMYRLQQMVIEKDPIKYLGEHI